MKKALKLLLSVMVIALLVGALCIFASAETESTDGQTAYYKVSIDGKETIYYSPEIASHGTSWGAKGKTYVVTLLNDCVHTPLTNISVSYDVTLNLNGHTLDMTYSGTVSSSKESRFNLGTANTTFVVNGGTSATDGVKGNYTTSSATSRLISFANCNVTFNNVIFTSVNGGTFFDFRIGALNFNDCTFNFQNGTSPAVFCAGQANVHPTVTFNRTTVNCNGAAVSAGRSDSGSTNATVIFNDSTINCTSSSYVFLHNGGGAAAASTFEGKLHSFTLNGTTVNAPDAPLFAANNKTNSHSEVIIGAGTVVNVKSVPVAGFYELKAADGVSIVYTDGVDFKGISAENTYKLEIRVPDTENLLTTVYAEKGTTPALPATFASPYYYLGSDNAVYICSFDGYVDASGNAYDLTALEADAVCYINGTAQKAAWAAFGTDKVTERSIVYATTDPEINNALKSTYRLFVCYSDITYMEDNKNGTTINWTLTMDLNGFTLTSDCSASSPSDGCLRPSGADVIFTLKNGTVKIGKNKLLYSGSGAKCVVTDANLICTTSFAGHFNDIRGGDVTFEDCVVKYEQTKSTSFIAAAGMGGSTKCVVTLKNVVFQGGASTGKIVEFSHSNTDSTRAGKADYKVGLVVDNVTCNLGISGYAFGFNTVNTVDISVTNSSFTTASALFKFIKNPNKAEANTNPYVFNVTVENVKLKYNNNVTGSSGYDFATNQNGFVIANSGDTTFPYVATAKYVTYKLTADGTSLNGYYALGAYPSRTEAPFVGVKKVDKVDTVYCTPAEWYEANIMNRTAGEVVEFNLDTVRVVPAYGIIASDGSLFDYGESTTVKATFMSKAPDGSTIILYKDIALDDYALNANGKSDSYSMYIGGNTSTVVLDLNGHTLDLSATNAHKSEADGGGTINGLLRLNLQGNKTIKNGTVINDATVYYLDSTGTNTFTLDNVVTKVTNAAIFDARKNHTVNIIGGELNIIDTNADSNDYRAFALGYNLCDIVVNVTNTTINANRLVGYNPKYESVSSMVLNFSNCEINCSDYLLFISSSNKGLKPETTLDLNFTGCDIKSLGYSVIADVVETVTYDNCRLNYNPTSTINEVNTVLVNVAYAQGQTALVTEDDTYGYKVGAVNLSVSANLTLYSDFTINLYLGNNVTKVTVDGNELALEEYDATKVKVALKGIAPNTAADTVVFMITYVDGGKTYTAKFSYSVAKYATTLLAGSYSDEAKALVANAVKYIDAAYTVADAEKPAILTTLTASAGYTAALEGASNVAKENIDGAGNYNALAVAINSAQLRLSDDYRYVLNLNESYTGTIKVNNVTYNVVNGTVNGKTYVTVTLRGYEFNDGLTVTATTADGAVEGVYTLADYVEAMANGTDAELDALLVALYNFTVEAKEYNDFVKSNGLK